MGRLRWLCLLATALLASKSALLGQFQQPATGSTVAAGSIRYKWIHGSIAAANNRDPRIQAVAYNADTVILRENVAVHWEAPFTYLLAGADRVLLIDTGATTEGEYYPLRATVDGIVARWASLRNKRDLPLIVVHTSAEDVAQNQGVSQFRGRANTTVLSRPDGSIDLGGGRLVTVIPTPGAHKDGITLYDRYTGLLYTGDLLFPGRIVISNDSDYVASLERLQKFAAANPVKWLLGGHIEMSNAPGVQYIMRTTFKPNEHVLQLEPEAIGEALLHARRIQGKAEVAIRAEFILLNRVGPDERGDWPSDLPAAPAPAFALR